MRPVHPCSTVHQTWMSQHEHSESFALTTFFFDQIIRRRYRSNNPRYT